MNLRTAIRGRALAAPFALTVALCGISTASAQSVATPASGGSAPIATDPNLHADGATLVRQAAPIPLSSRTQAVAPTPAGSTGRAPRTIASQNFPQLVNDPGFEGGYPNAYWNTYSSGPYPAISSRDPYASNYSADLCGYGNCTSFVQQGLTVPDNVSSTGFSFLVDTFCPPDSTPCAQGNNGMNITLADGSGNSLSLLQLWDVGNPSNYTDGYVQLTLKDTSQLTAWLQPRGGQDITLTFSASTVNGNAAEWFIDNVSFTVTAPPNAPVLSSTSSPASGDVSINWSPPADAGLNHVSAYNVLLYNAHRTVVSETQVSSSASTYTFTGLANGQPYYAAVQSVNPTGAGGTADASSLTPFGGAASPNVMNATSTQQYLLPNSDGSTWQRIDETNLSFEITTTSSSETVVLSGNADLWTGDAGINQDLGICEELSPTATDTCTNSNVVAWKESGGKAGTFSPNAAFVQTVVSLSASSEYRFDLVWKSNTSAIGATVAAGAGGGPYSPTSLTARVVDASEQSGVSTQQYTLPGSDGTTWNTIDPSLLQISTTPTSTEQVVLSGNADLWTGTAGVNQDLAITISPAADCGGSAPSTTAAWKESGGNAGTFSPNAAFVQTVCTLTATTQYTIDLAWKANKATGHTIFIGAGSGPYSPTRLLMFALPANTSPTLWATQAIATQSKLSNSDGTDWAPLGNVSSGLLSPSADETVLLSANVDLWTANAGVNQDVGIYVQEDSNSLVLVGWKESGGNGGTFSPNAAFLQIAYGMQAGHTYTFFLYWKTNHSTGGTIFAGAGPLGNAYSPTRLLVMPA